MKNSAVFILCFLNVAVFSVYAQQNKGETPKGQIGITFSSFGENDVIRRHDLVGAASYNGDKFYAFGVNYLYKLNNALDVETGMEYLHHKIIIIPNLPPQMDNSPRGATISLLNIPVTIRLNFLKYFFVNGGILFDIDVSKFSPVASQTGLGGTLGGGIKYDFDGFSVIANPYSKVHSLVPFSSDNSHQRLIETGFRLGLMFQL